MVTPKKIIMKDLELADEEIARLRKENKELKLKVDMLEEWIRIKEDIIEEYRNEMYKLKNDNKLEEINERVEDFTETAFK